MPAMPFRYEGTCQGTGQVLYSHTSTPHRMSSSDDSSPYTDIKGTYEFDQFNRTRTAPARGSLRPGQPSQLFASLAGPAGGDPRLPHCVPCPCRCAGGQLCMFRADSSHPEEHLCYDTACACTLPYIGDTHVMDMKDAARQLVDDEAQHDDVASCGPFPCQYMLL